MESQLSPEIDLVASESDTLEVFGARVHNLKNIDVSMPRNQLVVITGMSGSGKSSLAFDTIYAEGQRSYIESFSAYARQFLGKMERPDVDKITGLAPVISIEQKTVNRSPRSTVGTITEVYDFMRLLYARASDAYSYVTGEKMVKYSDEQILSLILEEFENRKLNILSPVIRARKGHYRDLFESIAKKGYIRVRVDGEVREITSGMKLDRYKVHDIEIVIDRLIINEDNRQRLLDSLKTALKQGDGLMMVLEEGSEKPRFFSRNLMCPTSGISYSEPEPNLFSFNSPYGACKKCNGIGEVSEIDIKKVIPDDSLSIKRGGIAPLGEYKNSWIFKQVEAIGNKYGFKLTTPIKDISEEAIEVLLYGTNDRFTVKNEYLGVSKDYEIKFEGIVNWIVNQYNEKPTKGYARWAQSFMNKVTCPTCNGARLQKESLYFKLDGLNISKLASKDIVDLHHWFENIEARLSEKQLVIAREVLKEIKTRLGFLIDVGLDYLTLNRSAKTLSGG
jgi:excinuclease ABC subunit A